MKSVSALSSHKTLNPFSIASHLEPHKHNLTSPTQLDNPAKPIYATRAGDWIGDSCNHLFFQIVPSKEGPR